MLLMKMVYEYLKYLVNKKFTDLEPVAKIKDVIMLYNSATYQLIIAGGSVMCQAVSQITTKILALSITEMRF